MANGMPGRDSRECERAELKRVLASPLFSRAPALSRILSYLCTKYFEGEADSIKEHTIAVEALGRSHDFDPATDTIVRVEASRLRKRLQEYYKTEGSDHEVQILLPETGYRPQFVYRSAAREATEPAPDVPSQAPAEREGAGPARLRSRFIPTFLWGGVLLLVITLLYAGLKLTVPSPVTGSTKQAAVEADSGEEIRILAGFQGPKVIDSLGRTWSSDRYYKGGTAVERRFRRVYRTRSQELYRTAREGDFSYDIPLKPGVYELHLHFVEIIPEELDLDSGGEQTSRFRVFVNDRLALQFFDVVVDAGGPNVADERVFTDVSPASDGYLHLRFASSVNRAHVTGIEILPGIPGKMRPVRIVAALESCYDSSGRLWGSDRYFLGGRITRRSAPVSETLDSKLYSSERWGHFSYSIPVAPGRYRLTLRFAETYPSQIRVGDRIFDVHCNGTTLLKNFDILREAGSVNRAVEKVFRHVPANAQGKLLLSFVPVRNYAIVNAIEVATEE